MSVRNILNYTNNEDTYIISKSGSSLFKEGYEKYTNFSKNYLDVYSESTSFKSKETVLFDIEKIGDLLSGVTLLFEIKKNIDLEKKNIENLGYSLIDNITFLCGDEELSSLSGDWIYIRDQVLYGGQSSYSKSMSSIENSNLTGDIYSLMVDIPFWFCQEINKAFPLISLQNENISIRLKLSNYSFNKINIDITKTKLVCEYIVLNNWEKNNFLNNSLEYIIEEVIEIEDNLEKKTSSVKKIQIDKYLFVNQLIWIIKNKSNNIENLFDFSLDSTDKNHIQNIRILFNGKSINGISYPDFYRKIQNYENNDNYLEKNKNVYTYSFALNTNKIYPSGFSSFNKYNTIVLELKILPSNTERILKTFVKHFNIIRISDGYLNKLV